MNKIKDYINGEIFHVHGQEDSILSGVRTFQLDLQIQCILKLSASQFVVIDKVYSKFYWKSKKLSIDTILKEENQRAEISILQDLM